VRIHKSEIIHVHDAVATINNMRWPAYRKRKFLYVLDRSLSAQRIVRKLSDDENALR
jgi:hypothetical protein